MAILTVEVSRDNEGPNPKFPSISAVVGMGLQSRRVTCLDLSCNGIATVIGLAMVIFAAVIFGNTAQEFGWATNKIALFSIMGAVGVAGIIVTILSIKWIMEGYQKYSKFRDEVSDIT